MTAFIAIATVMVVIALAWLLWPLLRAGRRVTVERHVANATIYRDQFADLDADLRRGTLSEAQYAEAKAELERRLLDEGRAEGPANTGAPATASRTTAVVVALAVPLLAGLLYWKLGAPDAFSPLATRVDDAHKMTAGQVEEMVQQLAAKLEKEPDNIEGWVLLAKTYYAMRKFPEAAVAYERLNKLVPNEPDLMADYADALAMSQGRTLEGKPLELVNAALMVDPTHWKALAMAGTAAFNRKDYKGAVDYWEKLKSSQPADSQIGQQITASIDEARRLGGMPPATEMAAAPQKGGPAKSTPPVAAAPAAAPATQAAVASGGTTVGGTVNLSDAVKAKVAPTDTVFIFARAAEGSRMPLALTSVKVSELPAKFTLDDTMGMSPDMKLSSAPSLIVGARVSKSGRPMPSSGDLEGLSKPVALGAKDVAVTIDRVLP